jgi:hypothetical membrane protein
VKTTRLGAVLWIACLQYFAAEAVAISGWPGRYSLSQNYISDLGALGCDANQCSPLHALMNASFLLQGLLIALGTALVWPGFPKGKLWIAALALVAASGVGVFVVGLYPEDTVSGLHYLGAAENFLFCNAGMAAMGVALLVWRAGGRAMGLITVAAGVVGLLAFAAIAAHVDLGLGVGGIERVTAYPFPLWLAGMGAALLRRGGVLKAAA